MTISYKALEVLAEFARFNNLRDTAASLNVTEGAVSKQLKALQDRVGVALLRRVGGNLELTPDGKLLASVSQDSFEKISNCLEQLQRSQTDKALRLACVPTFFACWLLPRIGKLHEAIPDIEIEFLTKSDVHELSPRHGDIDALIDVGRLPIDEQLTTAAFMGNVCGPVATSHYLDSLPSKSGSPDLSQATWLCSTTRKDTLERFEPDILPEISPDSIIWYDSFFLCLQAARAGLGLTISSSCYVEDEIENGELVAPIGMHPQTTPFLFAWDSATQKGAQLRQILKWLRDEARYSTLKRH